MCKWKVQTEKRMCEGEQVVEVFTSPLVRRRAKRLKTCKEWNASTLLNLPYFYSVLLQRFRQMAYNRGSQNSTCDQLISFSCKQGLRNLAFFNQGILLHRAVKLLKSAKCVLNYNQDFICIQWQDPFPTDETWQPHKSPIYILSNQSWSSACTLVKVYILLYLS